MGPIERQFVDRGGTFNEKQLKEVQELDNMIKGMGNLGGLDMNEELAKGMKNMN